MAKGKQQARRRDLPPSSAATMEAPPFTQAPPTPVLTRQALPTQDPYTQNALTYALDIIRKSNVYWIVKLIGNAYNLYSNSCHF